MEELLREIQAVIRKSPDRCQSQHSTCDCPAVDVVRKMHELGMLSERGEELFKWVS